jgi:PAS domain S-box-containing protein
MEEGQHAMEPIRHLVAEMISAETGLLREREAIQDENVEGTMGFSVLMSTLSLGLFVWLFLLFTRADRRRHRAEEMVQETNLELGRRVRERTAELSQTVERLEPASEFRGKVMESAVFGLGVLDRQGRFTLANEQLAGLMGYGAKELVSQPYSILLSPENDASLRPLFLQVLREKRTLAHHEIDVIRKDGSIANVIFSWSPLLTQGEVCGVVCTLLDISMKKWAGSAPASNCA